MEVEDGRATEAVVRLLGRVRQRASDPELYAGLVHACRYAGLLDASIAAFHRARRLDPAIRTTVAHSFFMSGDFERAIAADIDDPAYLTAFSLLCLGRTEDAIAHCHAAYARMPTNTTLSIVLDAVTALAEGDRDRGATAVLKLLQFPAFTDPEGLYYWTLPLAGLGDALTALDLLERAVRMGWYCVNALETVPLLSILRPDPRFAEIVDRARVRQAAALRAFDDADGPRLLGLLHPTAEGTH